MARKPVSVSQINSYLARLIAADSVLSDIAVRGEVSNFKEHGSGHVYFSLKDEGSRLDCFLPSGVFRSLGFKIEEGSEIVCEGYVNVYEKGGRYSLSIRRVLDAGDKGDLAKAFEELKRKLAEKGYFDENKKKTLPAFPMTVAIVTSRTGAAVEDMTKIITTRNSVADILIFPTLVQGDGAAENIALQIRRINSDFAEVDVMIVGRGGGSIEDLWAFNEEPVADAIFESVVPVISAVGHETDFTIADFVADKRAETPTAAAMMAVPDTDELWDDIEALAGQLKNSVTALGTRAELRLRANNMNALLGQLKSGISERRTHAASLLSEMKRAAHEKTDRLPELSARLTDIRSAALTKVDRVTELDGRLAGIRNLVLLKAERYDNRAQMQREKLKALNPLNVLSRGYAIVEDEGGRAIGRAAGLKTGQNISARFTDGSAAATVNNVELTSNNQE